MDEQTKRNRSPNFPAISLRVSMDYLTELHKFANGTHFVPLLPALEGAWKMKSGSAYGKQVAAALKAFGLVEDKGIGDNRMIRITDGGAKINGSHSDRPNLLKEAAVCPTVHQELWAHYQGNLPPDVTLRQYLVFDRDGNKFNVRAVDDFIKEFRDTLDFAKLVEGDIVTPEQEVGNDGDVPNPPNGGGIDTVVKPPPPKAPGMKQDVYGLDEGDLVLVWPSRLSKESYLEAADWLDLLKRKLKRAVVAEEPPKPPVDVDDPDSRPFINDD